MQLTGSSFASACWWIEWTCSHHSIQVDEEDDVESGRSIARFREDSENGGKRGDGTENVA
jgi:hypothetical protein